MTRENDLLTDDELIELTGYRFPSKQCSALAKSAFIQISTVTITNQPQKNASQLAQYQCPYLSYGQDMRH